jgi:hypothetical protein
VLGENYVSKRVGTEIQEGQGRPLYPYCPIIKIANFTSKDSGPDVIKIKKLPVELYI